MVSVVKLIKIKICENSKTKVTWSISNSHANERHCVKLWCKNHRKNKLGASNSMILIPCHLPQLERKRVSYGIGKKTDRRKSICNLDALTILDHACETFNHSFIRWQQVKSMQFQTKDFWTSYLFPSHKIIVLSNSSVSLKRESVILVFFKFCSSGETKHAFHNCLNIDDLIYCERDWLIFQKRHP